MATDEQGKLYLTQLVNAVASMRPTAFELEETWNAVVRQHRTSVWPTPGVICQALTDYRARVANVARQAALAAPPERAEPPEDLDAYDPVRDAEALRICQENARRHPEDKLWQSLLRLHAGFERRTRARRPAA